MKIEKGILGLVSRNKSYLNLETTISVGLSFIVARVTFVSTGNLSPVSSMSQAHLLYELMKSEVSY